MTAISSFKTCGIMKWMKPNPNTSCFLKTLSWCLIHCLQIQVQTPKHGTQDLPSSFCSWEPRMEFQFLPLPALHIACNSWHTHTNPKVFLLWSLFTVPTPSGTVLTATLIVNQNVLQALLSLGSLFRLLRTRLSAFRVSINPRSRQSLHWLHNDVFCCFSSPLS